MPNYIIYGALILCGIVVAPNIANQSLLSGFLYVDYSLNTMQNPYEFPPATKIQYANNYARGLFYSLGQHYNRPLKYLDLTVAPKQDSDTAILLVHGFGRNQGDWNWLRKQFAATNSWVYTVDLKPTLGGIEEIAQSSLIPKIAAIKQQSGCQNIILIGASMGGLVASYYKEHLDQANDVKAVITLGSSLHGTRVAVAAPGINARQMCPESKFLQDLRASMNKHPQYYYQVASKFDEVVFPWNSALLENTAKPQQLILQFEGHLGLLHNKDVATKLNEWVIQIQQSNQVPMNDFDKTVLFSKGIEEAAQLEQLQTRAETSAKNKTRGVKFKK
jgi:pimeloyl-ACP methyl ester carboxylesterase